MSSTDSKETLSDVLTSLSESMANFRTESTEVESEFYGLVDGLRGLGPVNVKPAASTVEPPVLDSTTVEHLENLDRSIAQ